MSLSLTRQQQVSRSLFFLREIMRDRSVYDARRCLVVYDARVHTQGRRTSWAAIVLRVGVFDIAFYINDCPISYISHTEGCHLRTNARLKDHVARSADR